VSTTGGPPDADAGNRDADAGNRDAGGRDDDDERERERLRRAAARLPGPEVNARAGLLAVAAVFFLGLILGFVLGRTA
jgi:hypothetical protein